MTKTIAWIGGGLFVASLALTAWWYFVALGEPQREGGNAALAIDALLLTIFACPHSLFARETVKQRLTFIPEVLTRSFYVWVASTLLILAVLLWRAIGRRVAYARRVV